MASSGSATPEEHSRREPGGRLQGATTRGVPPPRAQKGADLLVEELLRRWMPMSLEPSTEDAASVGGDSGKGETEGASTRAGVKRARSPSI